MVCSGARQLDYSEGVGKGREVLATYDMKSEAERGREVGRSEGSCRASGHLATEGMVLSRVGGVLG